MKNGLIQTEQMPIYQIVVLCFGTPTVAGDSLGPLTGSALIERGAPCFVYGTLNRPVTAKNMDDYMNFIKCAHDGALLLAVDAGLGDKGKIGSYSIRSDGVCPAAVGGKKARVGDVGILGIVGSREGDHYAALLSASTLKVQEMANKLSVVIKCAVESFIGNMRTV